MRACAPKWRGCSRNTTRQHPHFSPRSFLRCRWAISFQSLRPGTSSFRSLRYWPDDSALSVTSPVEVWARYMRPRIRNYASEFAIKTIRADILVQPNAMARFKRGIYLARKVTHPNVCRIFDCSRHKPDDGSGERRNRFYGHGTAAGNDSGRPHEGRRTG